MMATTTETRLTNFQNYPYPLHLAELIELIKNTELEDELDREDLLAFALYVYNGSGFALPSAETLAELYESHREAYVGDYTETAEFAREICEDEVIDVPSYIVIDWQATWERNLRHDFFDYELITDFDGVFSAHRFIWRAI